MATTRVATLADTTNLKHQFLAMVPIRNLELMNAQLPEDLDDQLEILEKTILSPIVKKYPPSVAYRRTFLKTLLKKLEALGIEVCDQLYEEYTKLIAMPEDDTENCYRTYTLADDQTITMKESTRVISHGTTGLQTWPAALCLAEWAMENKQLLAGKRVVELGCGLGLTGLIICRTCHPSHYIFTDCHQHVLQTLHENIEINRCVRNADSKGISESGVEINRAAVGDLADNLFDEETKSNDFGNDNESMNLTCKCHGSLLDTERNGRENCANRQSGEDATNPESCLSVVEARCTNCQSKGEINVRCGKCYKESSSSAIMTRFDCDVTMETLDWQTVEEGYLQEMHADVILAADVVYDTSIVPSLVNVLHKLLHSKGQEGAPSTVAYVASTIRNEETRQFFIQTLDTHGIKMKECQFANHRVFYYDTSCPITILQLTV